MYKQLFFFFNLVQLHILPENTRKAQMCLLTQGEKDPEEVLNAVTPLVWASGKLG